VYFTISLRLTPRYNESTPTPRIGFFGVIEVFRARTLRIHHTVLPHHRARAARPLDIVKRFLDVLSKNAAPVIAANGVKAPAAS
jgi:hypothetical protein